MIDYGKIKSLFDKRVVITCLDGEIVEGNLTNYTTEQDNEPYPESITVDVEGDFPWEIYTSDIQSIEEVIR